MKKISKVQNVQGSGTWESQYGLMYSFDYVMEDGTAFKANHKTDKHFNVGDEVEYEITKENEYGKMGKIGKPNPNQPGGNQGRSYQGKKPSTTTASFALAYAKDYAGFHIAKGIDYSPDAIIQTATIFNNWLKSQ